MSIYYFHVHQQGVPVWPCSTVMHVSVTVREPPLLEKVVLDCSLQQGHNNIPPFYFFACDITAAKLVVNNKSISLPSALGTKLYFYVTSSRTNSTVLTPNMAKWSHGLQTKNTKPKRIYIDKKMIRKSLFFTFMCHLCE